MTIQHQQKIMRSRFPFTSFPNGWFCIASSDELHCGDVKPIHYFGKDLVLFRTEDGTAHVFDAHCPHLGGHLGYGGKVKGDNIQCPFHGWCFDVKGECVDIPYANKIPPQAQTRTWFVRELNGFIWVYYHHQGEPPIWHIPESPEYKSQEWTSFRLADKWKVRSHIYQIGENTADVSHLPIVHSTTPAKLETLYTNNEILSLLYSKPDESFEITHYGLGYNVQRLGSSSSERNHNHIIVVFLTPVNEDYTEVKILVSVKKLFDKAATASFLDKFASMTKEQFERDIQIFENRVYPSNPLLCEGEGSITQYQHWASQFFSREDAKTKISVL